MQALPHDDVSERYLRLALALEQHAPGYIDAYFGPEAWKQEAEQAGKRPPDALASEAESLMQTITAAEALDEQRRDWLARQARAMQTTIRQLQGETLSLRDEVEALYDIEPEWVDESLFEEAHRQLDGLLPPGPTLAERMVARRATLEVSADRAATLFPPILAELRRRTAAHFPLPDDESFELHMVSNEPWGAYNWYLGHNRSRIDVNTDLPLLVTRLIDTMAHEGYPGHHTEHALKEAYLFRDGGRLEHAVQLINAPECVVSEGIATRALMLVMDDAEVVQWQQAELFPQAGLEHLDAAREYAIDNASRVLGGVRCNAAFMLHEQGASEEEVIAYVQRWGLSSEREGRQAVRFLTNPTFRSYIFTYRYGGELLDALFAARGDRIHWFGRLLREPVTPTQIRTWTSGTSEG